MNNYTVYKHIFPNGKIYIGITCRNPKIRWRNGNGYDTNIYMQNAIKKYGWKNVEHEILKTRLSKEEACDLECKLIEEYKSNIREFGYNIESGGIKNKGISEETRQKLSNAFEKHRYKHVKKVFQYDLNGNFIRTWYCIMDAIRALKLPIKARDAIICCCKGANWGKNLNIRLTAYGYIWLYDNNIEERLRLIKKHSRNNIQPVIQYTLDGKIVNQFPSYADAAKYMVKKYNCNFINIHTSISRSCNGSDITAHGYIWLKQGDDIQKRLELVKGNSVGVVTRIVYQYTFDGKIIAKYNSITEACKAIGVGSKGIGSISQCCHNTKKSAYGYIWAFDTNIEEKVKKLKKDPYPSYSYKSVTQYTLDGKFIKNYTTMIEAAMDLVKTSNAPINNIINNIHSVCMYKSRFSSYGYIWAYFGDSVVEKVQAMKNCSYRTNTKAVLQYSLDGQYLNRFPTVNSAYRSLGRSTLGATNISKCCKGQIKNAFGFIWKYE
jgi:hypothetical protein